jgi:hypothetical protein
VFRAIVSQFNRFLLCSLLAVVAASIADHTLACEACRRFGTSAFHVDESAGGDAFNDALTVGDDGQEAGSGGIAPIVSKWDQPGGLGSPIYLTYSYENMFDGGLLMPNGQPLPATLIKKSIEEALRLWASVVPVHFTEVEDNGLPYNNPSATYGDIRFRHVHINGPDPPPPADPIAKAQAYYPTTGSVLGGDVEYDHSDRWQESGTRPVPDILGATIHELGHSLGIAHSQLPTANMYWIFTRYSGLGQGALTQDDIDSIQANYGAGVGSVTPLVPEPTLIALLVGGALAMWSVHRRSRNGSAI